MVDSTDPTATTGDGSSTGDEGASTGDATSGNGQFATDPTTTAGGQASTGDAAAGTGGVTAGSGQLATDGHLFVIPAHPNTQFDDENFLNLLEGSISLTYEEKKRVIDAIPRLKIEQIHELISIFEEEKKKFAELEKEYADDVAKLKAERTKEIEINKIKEEEAGQSEADVQAAEDIKRQMGL